MYAQKSYGAAVHRQQNRQPRSMLIVLRTRKSSFFSLCLKGGKICTQNGITAPRQEKPGYTPVCRNEWVPGLCDKRERRCPDCPNREFLPLTAEVVKHI